MGMMVDPLGMLLRARAALTQQQQPQKVSVLAAPGTYIQGPYVTQLPPQQEAQFQQWIHANKVPSETASGVSDPTFSAPDNNYDMRAYWQAMQSKDPNAAQQLSAFDGTMHFPDTYKTPFHRSFSNESKYATQNAPSWKGDRLIDKSGKVLVDETPALTPEQAAQIRQRLR